MRLEIKCKRTNVEYEFNSKAKRSLRLLRLTKSSAMSEPDFFGQSSISGGGGRQRTVVKYGTGNLSHLDGVSMSTPATKYCVWLEAAHRKGVNLLCHMKKRATTPESCRFTIEQRKHATAHRSALRLERACFVQHENQ